MGAFLLVRQQSGVERGKILESTQAQLSRQGFSRPRVLGTDEYDLFVYKKIVNPGENCIEFGNGDFCSCTGTFIYKCKTGSAGLRLFYDDFRPDSIDFEGLYGAFCFIIRKDGRTYVLLDSLSIYKVYRTSDNSVWSTSFLAALSALETRRADTQGVYEYVFQGATYGSRTVMEGVRLLEPGKIYEIGRGDHSTSISLSWPGTYASVEDALDRNIANLREFYHGIVTCFDGGIDTALSGGYDSRLTLALLRDQGVTPNLHVYGRPQDADVKVASEISENEGLALLKVDKSQFAKVGVEEFPQTIATAFHDLDGYPNDGIFGNGSDLTTRKDRCRDGKLMLNGGGGEIFRNFFYIRDKRFTVRQFLWIFYSRFDPRTCTTRFSEEHYYEQLAEKIKAVLGTDDDVLERRQIDLLYPLFRCRFWMARNNAVNNRLGNALTPFIDYKIVAGAMTVPTRAKDYGNFEARMIRAVDPSLASYESAYGHSFAADAPLANIVKEYLNYLRPSRLRRVSYRLKTLRASPGCPYYLTRPYISASLGNELTFMREFFLPDSIHDWGQYNRICTLEYLFQRFQPDLAEAL